MNIIDLATKPIQNLQKNSSTDLPHATEQKLKQSARDFEAAFLAEALGHMGFDASNGVAGASEFSSILNRAYAERLVDKGGIGLSENIFRALAASAEEK